MAATFLKDDTENKANKTPRLTLVEACKKTFNFGTKISLQPEFAMVAFDFAFFGNFFVGWIITLIWNPAFVRNNPILIYFNHNNVCVGLDSLPARFVFVFGSRSRFVFGLGSRLGLGLGLRFGLGLGLGLGLGSRLGLGSLPARFVSCAGRRYIVICMS